jgi:hypothetical protein
MSWRPPFQANRRRAARSQATPVLSVNYTFMKVERLLAERDHRRTSNHASAIGKAERRRAS